MRVHTQESVMPKTPRKKPGRRIHVIMGPEECAALEAESKRLGLGLSPTIRSILRQWFASQR